MKEKLINQCPFGMKKHEECTFFRRGIRIIPKPNGGEENVPFEECAINIIADCLENLVGRNIALQQEMNLVRNEVLNTNQLFAEILSRPPIIKIEQGK